MNSNGIYLNSLGIINCLGTSKEEVIKSLLSNKTGLITTKELLSKRKTKIGYVDDKVLPEIPKRFKKYECRNNKLALHACMQIDEDINKVINKYSVDRVAIVCGTSTSGIDNGEKALADKFLLDKFPEKFDYKQQETVGLSDFFKRVLSASKYCLYNINSLLIKWQSILISS